MIFQINQLTNRKNEYYFSSSCGCFSCIWFLSFICYAFQIILVKYINQKPYSFLKKKKNKLKFIRKIQAQFLVNRVI